MCAILVHISVAGGFFVHISSIVRVFSPYFFKSAQKLPKNTSFAPATCTIFRKMCVKVRKNTCFDPFLSPIIVLYFTKSAQKQRKVRNLAPFLCHILYYISGIGVILCNFGRFLPLFRVPFCAIFLQMRDFWSVFTTFIAPTCCYISRFCAIFVPKVVIFVPISVPYFYF